MLDLRLAGEQEPKSKRGGEGYYFRFFRDRKFPLTTQKK